MQTGIDKQQQPKTSEQNKKVIIYETVIVKNDPMVTKIDKIYNEDFDTLPKFLHFEFLEDQEQYIFDKVAVIAARARETEKGILFERSMCYHRNAHRAFQNFKVCSFILERYHVRL